MLSNKLILVGISGPQRAGKTTLANALAKMVNGRVMHLAEPIYEMARILVGKPVVKEEEYFKSAVTGRRILQVLGTECGRSLDPDIWVDRLRGAATGITFVPDVRFLNEAFSVHSLIYLDAVVDQMETGHESERHLDELRAMAGIRLERRGDRYYFENCEITLEEIWQCAFRACNAS